MRTGALAWVWNTCNRDVQPRWILWFSCTLIDVWKGFVGFYLVGLNSFESDTCMLRDDWSSCPIRMARFKDNIAIILSILQTYISYIFMDATTSYIFHESRFANIQRSTTCVSNLRIARQPTFLYTCLCSFRFIYKYTDKHMSLLRRV